MICDGLWSSCVWFTLKDKIKITNCIASVYGSGMTDDMYSHTQTPNPKPNAFMQKIKKCTSFHCGVLEILHLKMMKMNLVTV